MDSISRAHEQLLSEGMSITDLYIYDCIINDECGFGSSDMSIEEKFEKIKNNYANDGECRSLAYHIEAVLNGEFEEYEFWD